MNIIGDTTEQSNTMETANLVLAKIEGNRTLMIDNYDSFTYNVYQYLEQLGANVTVFRNDKVGH